MLFFTTSLWPAATRSWFHRIFYGLFPGGLLTTFGTLTALILYTSLPNSDQYLFIVLCLSKLYGISILLALNTRRKRDKSSPQPRGLPLKAMSVASTGRTPRAQRKQDSLNIVGQWQDGLRRESMMSVQLEAGDMSSPRRRGAVDTTTQPLNDFKYHNSQARSATPLDLSTTTDAKDIRDTRAAYSMTPSVYSTTFDGSDLDSALAHTKTPLPPRYAPFAHQPTSLAVSEPPTFVFTPTSQHHPYSAAAVAEAAEATSAARELILEATEEEEDYVEAARRARLEAQRFGLTSSMMTRGDSANSRSTAAMRHRSTRSIL